MRGGKIYFSEVSSVETPDPTTVVFKLRKPVPFFLKAFQPTEAPMFPPNIFWRPPTLTKFRQSDFMQHPVGTGPFQLKEWKKGSYIILERNPNYWKAGHPYLDRVVMRAIPDDNGRVVALQNGEVDLAPMNAIAASSVGLLQKNPNLVVSHDGAEGLGPVAGLIVNLDRKPLGDLKGAPGDQPRSRSQENHRCDFLRSGHAFEQSHHQGKSHVRRSQARGVSLQPGQGKIPPRRSWLPC